MGDPAKTPLVALQGPTAEAALSTLLPDVAAMRFMDVWPLDIGGKAVVVSRSGYTGEDGFEISVEPAAAARVCRCSLRMPVGYCTGSA